MRRYIHARWICATEDLMYCSKCGKDNPDDAVFCRDCGASLNGSRSTSPGAAYGNNNIYAVAPQKSTGLGIILSILYVGLGHLYAGAITKGILLIVIFTLLGSAMLVSLVIYSIFSMFILVIVALILWIWSIYDTSKMINQYNQHIRSTGNPPWWVF